MSCRRWRVLVSGLVVGIALAIASLLPCEMPNVDALQRPGELSCEPQPLYGGTPVVQEFLAQGTGLDAVDLQLATYRRHNKGLLRLRVARFENGAWTELASITEKKRYLDDNAYHRFEFSPRLRVRRGDRLAITLVVKGSEDHAIAWYYTPQWRLPSATMRVGDEVIDGTAHFQPLYRSDSRLGGMGWWRRVTVLLRPPASALLASSALLALALFVHMSLWPGRPESDRDLPSGKAGAGVEARVGAKGHATDT